MALLDGMGKGRALSAMVAEGNMCSGAIIETYNNIVKWANLISLLTLFFKT